MAINTIDVDELAAKTGNIYESVAIISKRARQVASNTKSELDDKLSYFEGFGPDMEDARMQEEQAKISVEYELQPEPTVTAIQEFKDDELYHRNSNE
jgi:DNA-directed RNA polymerase subunit K/omega